MSYDNVCKYLAEQYPEQFASWLLSSDISGIQVLKTELPVEPIRADSVTFLQTTNQILHLEFQTLPTSNPPLPFRMLKYWTRLYDEYRCDIEQVVIFLKSTTSETVYINQFESRNTRHRYRIIRLWEQDPQPLLANAALLPLATLARTDSPRALLEQVALQVATIEETQQRQNVSACAELLAGLRFEKDLISQLFREEIMQESVIYQDILQKGQQRGEVALIMRQLTRRFGAIAPELQTKIQQLSIPQLEDLGEALLDFSSVNDLIAWLETQEE
ncbi:MAG: DUF4351 domain-containing protein [Cyanobacteriota bacterium]